MARERGGSMPEMHPGELEAGLRQLADDKAFAQLRLGDAPSVKRRARSRHHIVMPRRPIHLACGHRLAHIQRVHLRQDPHLWQVIIGMKISGNCGDLMSPGRPCPDEERSARCSMID